ncbi:globin [Luteimonas dalianensis]|uniref:globin n=1 Tax=Luteimonas dalianensis TaxID=1148196 RepID=UPI003BF13433
MTDQYEDLQQSYGRCLRDKAFISRFYDVFLKSHPSIPAMFAETDFSKQRMAMRRGISAAIFHAAGSTLSRRTVEQMADVHGGKGRCPVDPALYPYWIDSLVRVIEQTDPEMDDRLRMRWRQAMGVVCETFSGRYEAA